MKKLLLLLLPIVFIGCATDDYVLQKKNIEESYQKGEITKYQELQLLNDLYKSAQSGEGAVVVYQPNSR